MDTVFIMSHIPDPRMNKRIAVAMDCGSVAVVCIRRKSADIYEPQMDVKHHIIDMDMPDSRHLVKRVRHTMSYFLKARKHLKKYRPKTIYADGFDSLLPAFVYGLTHRVITVYEVADLREIFIQKPASLLGKCRVSIIKLLEKLFFSRVNHLVVTSEKFYQTHYHRLLPEEQVLFIPNMPDLSAFRDYTKKTGGRFTIGFIGGIRYLEQMKLLVDAAGEQDADVLFAGAGGTDSEYHEIRQYCSNKEHVDFTGRYQYDQDIARLYGSVDCIYAVYDADNPNVRIALPNKLYESVYCELPVIVAKGTYLSELVTEWEVGIAVAHNSLPELKTCISTLKNDRRLYQKLSEHCKLRKEEININRYNEKLAELIKGELKGLDESATVGET